MKKNIKYSEEQIKKILTTAYPGKSEEEIEAMVTETMAQYLDEAERSEQNKNKQEQ